MIRIISGIYRGRKINVPEGKNIKATSDEVREAIFNILSSQLNWQEKTVIDLYAGKVVAIKLIIIEIIKTEITSI